MAPKRTASRKKTSWSSGGDYPSKGFKSRAKKEPTHGNAASKPSDDKPTTGLYLIATPIGNAGDITLRALQILKSADIIACEDTRVTSKLLAIHGVFKPLKPYHEHNAGRVRPDFIKRLKNGETVALVSDAGTPLISDPGYGLLQACISEGIFVTALPGPSSALTALVLSGLPTNRFLFAGFPPSRSGGRRKVYRELASVPASLIFMESPRRLAAALADMLEILGPRHAAIGRELTKKFEEVRRGPLSELAAHYKAEGAPKGEVTIVVAPPEKDNREIAPEDLDNKLRKALRGASVRDAATKISFETGLPRSRLYERALELKKKFS